MAMRSTPKTVSSVTTSVFEGDAPASGGFKRTAPTGAPFHTMRIEEPCRRTQLLWDAPPRGSRVSWNLKRRLLQGFLLVAIISTLCLAPGADALFLKKKLKLLKAHKGKFGLGHQPHYPAAAPWVPQPQWVPPPPPVAAPPVAPWSYPGDYAAWLPPQQPAHGWVPGPPHVAHVPAQAPTPTYVLEAPTAAVYPAGKARPRPRGPQDYQYTLHCPYELYVTADQPANNKDRW